LSSRPTLDPFADALRDDSIYLGGLILATEIAKPESDGQMDALPLPALNETVLANVLLPALYSSACLAHVLAYLAFETAPSRACTLSDTSMSTAIDVGPITSNQVPENSSQMVFSSAGPCTNCFDATRPYYTTHLLPDPIQSH
jgi:hypothetical protein